VQIAPNGRPPATEGRPPFRADHIGSLLRPRQLREAFRKRAAGEIQEAGLHAVQDDAIRAALTLQQDCGLQVATDGEFRRTSYWARFVSLTRGLTVREAKFRFHDGHGHESDFTAPHVTGKVGRGAPITLDEYEFLKRNTTLAGKVTMPAPSTMHFWRGAGYADPGVYESARVFFADLGKVYQQEIAELARAGCRYVQLDEVALAMLCDPVARLRVKAGGLEPDMLVDLYIEAINEALKDLPAGMIAAVHMCRGNYKGMYLSEGGYDSIAEQFFARAKVNHFLLEFDSPRAGDFAPLRFMPEDKGVVLGLVSSKTPQLEPVDLLRRRTEEAAKYVDLSRLAISPQCGFASTMGGNPVSEADERAKLMLCVEAARLTWR